METQLETLQVILPRPSCPVATPLQHNTTPSLSCLAWGVFFFFPLTRTHPPPCLRSGRRHLFPFGSFFSFLFFSSFLFSLPADWFSSFSRYMGPASRWQTRGRVVLHFSRAPAVPFRSRMRGVRRFVFSFSFPFHSLTALPSCSPPSSRFTFVASPPLCHSLSRIALSRCPRLCHVSPCRVAHAFATCHPVALHAPSPRVASCHVSHPPSLRVALPSPHHVARAAPLRVARPIGILVRIYDGSGGK